MKLTLCASIALSLSICGAAAQTAPLASTHPDVFGSGTARAASPPAENANGRRLRDPKSGCAALDMNGLPVDAIEWSGTCAGGLANGTGTMTYSNQGKFFQSIAGTFDNGALRDGHVVVKWADGSAYDGNMVDSRMDGLGELTTRDGDRFQGQWSDNRLNGHARVVWANGDRYEGDWQDGKADGNGIQTWASGRKYDGEWRNDMPNGRGIVTREDGTRYESIFTDGQPGDMTELAAALPAAPVPKAPSADIALAPGQSNAAAVNAPPVNDAPASAPPANIQEAKNEPPSPRRGMDELAGKKLSAVDGSTFTLLQTEGGLTREIMAPNGEVKQDVLLFLTDRLGTMSEGDEGALSGVFRVSDDGLAIYYADGSSEQLTFNESGGVSMTVNAPGGGSSCKAWYPEGHVFGVDERKAALADYARRLGLDTPDEKASAKPAMTGCAAPIKTGALQPQAKISPAAYTKQVLAVPLPTPRPAPAPIDVRTSPVHLIDADPAVQSQDGTTLASNEPAARPGAASASTCLNVESDGHHWGFRNQCDYDVQFAYCQMMAGDALTSCRDGSIAGSVAAKSFGALIADETLKDVDANYDFRWIACAGGAGEVVVHMDKTDPPAGRCVRKDAS